MADVDPGGKRAPRWGRRISLGTILVAGALLAGGPSEGAAPAETPEPAPPKLAEVVKVEVVAPDGVMDDLRGGRLMVVIRNSSPEPLQVTSLDGEVAALYGDVRLSVLDAGRCTPHGSGDPVPCTIQGNEQALFPVTVEVSELTRTGKAPVAFDVGLEQGGVAGNAIATATVSLGVFGESELLPLLQVPSILVLPGALVLIALTVLWRFGVRPLTADKEFPWAASGLEFWFGAVALSAVLAVIWRCAFDRNLLTGYGYRDVAGVLVAAALALVVPVGWIVLVRRAQTVERAAALALRVAEGDDATTALSKLSERGEAARLRGKVVSRDGIARVVYQDGEGGGAMVVAGPLRVTLDADADDAAAVETAVRQLRAKGRVAALAKYLLGRVEAAHATAIWEDPPVEVVPEDYKPAGEERDLIEVDSE